MSFEKKKASLALATRTHSRFTSSQDFFYIYFVMIFEKINGRIKIFEK
jgi:hypothetical protein